MISSLTYRRSGLLLLVLATVVGCTGTGRLIGKWQGTFDGETHELEFTSTGRLRRSTDLIGGRSGWTSWKQTKEQGDKIWVTAGGQKLTVDFNSKDKILVFDKENQIRINMQRIDVETAEEQDSRSYATAYFLLALVVAFGLIAICRPSRREG